MKKQKGITLIALVITIVVLLILAGVTINLTLGERGIFRTAQKAAQNYQEAGQEEMYGLNSLQNEINDTLAGLGHNNTMPNGGVTNIKITSTVTFIKPGESAQLTATILPENATNKKITWKSENTDIATVEQDGTVTGVSEGVAIIIATAQDGSGMQGTYTISVARLLSEQITVANYGEYVNYEDGLDLGSSVYGHTTDWRIFYEDSDGYVYLISSYLLPYSQVPSGTDLQPYDGRPYTAYWTSAPSSYTTAAETSYTRYKMSFKYNGSYDNGYDNMKCVSQLMNTSVWKKFAINKANGNSLDLAEDAIGSPTLEMWVDSWNTTGNTALYYDNSNSYGYYLGTSSSPTSYYVDGLSTSSSLYFPVTSASNESGKYYWLASPSAQNAYEISWLMYVASGSVSETSINGSICSVRPLVRLKSTVGGQKDENGVWQLM